MKEQQTLPPETTDLWQECLKVMEGKLERPTFETCFKGSYPVAFHDDTLEIAVTNKFAMDWIAKKHTDKITRTFQKVSGKKWALDFSVSENGHRHHRDDDGGAGAADAAAAAAQDPLLNPRYTFDTFVVGNSNHLASAASLAVADAPAKAYNPLFLYGGVGLGKTHLMHAIGHHVLSMSRRSRVVYASMEQFGNELINAIQTNQTDQFRRKYRSVDVLLVDDIQFLVNKERTQEEFFHTFNHLHGASKQIVISSDRPPKEILTLEDRLRSRFEWGLIADIQSPDLETREAILRKKAELEKIPVSRDVISLIAEKVASNIRELEGALTRVIAFASLNKIELTLDVATEALKTILPDATHRPITMRVIQETVAGYFGIRMDELISERRDQRLAHPRQIAMFLARELTNASYPDIGKEFGGKDHTTIMHAWRKITDSANDVTLKATIEQLKISLTAHSG